MAKFISDEEMARIESQASAETASRPRFISDKEMKALEGGAKDEILGIPVTTIEGALQALPMAGALAGGTVGLSGGPLGAVAGAGLGAGAGEALANIARSALDLETAPQTRKEIYARPAMEGLKGAAGEGAGQALAKVPALLRSAPSALRGAIRGGGKSSGGALPSARFEDVGFNPSIKPNALEIREATKRIGGKATPGMVTSNQNIQNLENVLSQSPTLAGERVRGAYDPIRKGLQESAESLAGRPSVSSYEAGQQFKEGLRSKVAQRVEPLASQFEKIRESSANIRPDINSLHRAANRLVKQDLAEFSELPQGQAIQKYAGMIRNAKSLDSLKQLRSSVGDELGKALDAGDGQLAMALGKVKSSIQRLERREILKAAIEASPNRQAGEATAKELISEIKNVNKGWRALMTELQSVGTAGGLRKIESPKHLVRLIDEMPSEKIADRFFNTKNYRGLQDVKTHLPEEFETLRQARLGQIAEKSMTKGEPDPVKLIRNLKTIGPEARELLFGKDGERVLADMETVLNAMPSKVGASDTPRGMAWFSLLKPSQWAQEAQSAYSYTLLSGKPVKSSASQLKPGMYSRAAGYGAAAIASSQMEGGRDKWAKNGILKLNSHAGMSVLDESFDVSKANPKLRSLLIQASDLKPGSPEMDLVLKRITSEFGGGK